MATTVQCNYASRSGVVETMTGFGVGADNTVGFNGLDTSATLTGSTTPAVTKQATFQKAMSGGAGTIDFTALPGLNADEVVNGTGLSVQVVKFQNPSTNANPITITTGASSGLPIFGASGRVVLQPGQEVLLGGAAVAQAIDGTHKNVDISGTLSQVLNVQVVMG